MMKHLDVISVGSCYVDTNLPGYPFGKSGIPAETELVGGEYEITSGGSAVAFCKLLSGLGLKTAFVGMAGRDQYGDSLEAALRKDSIEPMLIRDDGLLTNISFNMTNPDGQHIMLVAGTANAALSPEPVLERIRGAVKDTKMLYLGGCFKLKKLAPAYLEIASLARQHDVVLVVDHNRIPEGTSPEMRETVRALLRYADYYLPSRHEFCELWEVDSIEDGMIKLHGEIPGLKIIAKDGANGAYYWDGDKPVNCPAISVEKVVHSTGAGDSFNAGVIVAMSRGLSVAEATKYGCVVGAAKVSDKPIPDL